MWWSRFALMMTLSFVIGCGFQPLHGHQGDVTAVSDLLSKTHVDPIDTRAGQILRNHLLDQLTPLGRKAEPRYRLSIKLQFSQESVALQKDETVTRKGLTVTAHYTLKSFSSGNILTQGSARIVAAYNVVQSDFATLTAERDAEQRAIRELSREITSRMSLFLLGHHKEQQ